MSDTAAVIVYQATNALNGHRYIGFTTKGMPVRERQHLKDAKHPKKGFRFHAAIRKYGAENFKFEVLADFQGDEELAKAFECEAIAAWKPEYNLSYGGDGGSMSDETRDKIRAAATGRVGTNLGKKFTDEHRRKIGEGQRGRDYSHMRKPMDEETKRKISLSNTGHAPTRTGPMSEETKQKLREVNKGKKPWIFGKNHSEETKRKQSDVKRLQWENPSDKQITAAREAQRRLTESNKKPVVCVTDGNRFESAKAAADFYGACGSSSIAMVANGKRKAYRGLVFRYVEAKE